MNPWILVTAPVAAFTRSRDPVRPAGTSRAESEGANRRSSNPIPAPPSGRAIEVGGPGAWVPRTSAAETAARSEIRRGENRGLGVFSSRGAVPGVLRARDRILAVNWI